MSDDERRKDAFPSTDETHDSSWEEDAVAPSGSDTAYTSSDDTADIDDTAGYTDTGSIIENFTAGGMLRAAREKQELSVEAVASALMLNTRVIECLERTMQPPGYDMRRTRISAKTYAKYLGIPADAVLADFPTDEQPRLATAVPRSSVTEANRGRATRFVLPAAVMAGVVVIGGTIAILMTPGQSAESRALPSVAERVVAVNTAQESLFARTPLDAAAADDLDLAIVALQPAWIEVRGPDGTIFRSRTMARDEAYYPRVGAGWTVTVKDGMAFEWQVNGRRVGRLADEALPIYSASIDEAAALAADHAEPTLAATSNSRPAR